MSGTKTTTGIINKDFAERHPDLAAAIQDAIEEGREERERMGLSAPISSEVEVVEPVPSELFPIAQREPDEVIDSSDPNGPVSAGRVGGDNDLPPDQRPRIPRGVARMVVGKAGEGENQVDPLHERFMEKELPWVPYSKAEMHTAAIGLDGWLARNAMQPTTTFIDRIRQVDRWITSSTMLATVLDKYDSGEAIALDIKSDLEALYAIALHDIAASSTVGNTWPRADSKKTKTRVAEQIGELKRLKDIELFERALHVRSVTMQRGSYWRAENEKVKLHPRVLEARSQIDHPQSHR